MGVFKKRTIGISTQSTVPASSETRYDDNDEESIGENQIASCGQEAHPKRRIGITWEDENVEEEEAGATVSRFRSSDSTRDESSKRIRLSADILKPLHRRLKIHSISEDKTIIAIIEDWIRMHCPE